MESSKSSPSSHSWGKAVLESVLMREWSGVASSRSGRLRASTLWLSAHSTWTRALASLVLYSCLWTTFAIVVARVDPNSYTPPSQDWPRYLSSTSAAFLCLPAYLYWYHFSPLPFSITVWHLGMGLKGEEEAEAAQLSSSSSPARQGSLPPTADLSRLSGWGYMLRRAFTLDRHSPAPTFSSAPPSFLSLPRRALRRFLSPVSVFGLWRRVTAWNVLLLLTDNLPKTLLQLFDLSYPYGLDMSSVPHWSWVWTVWGWPVLVTLADSFIFPLWYRPERAFTRRTGVVLGVTGVQVCKAEDVERLSLAEENRRWYHRSWLWLYFVLFVCLTNPVWPTSLFVTMDWEDGLTSDLKAEMKTTRIASFFCFLFVALITDSLLHCRTREHLTFLSLRQDAARAPQAQCSCQRWRLLWLTYTARWAFWAFMQYDLPHWFFPSTVRSENAYSALVLGEFVRTETLLLDFALFYILLALWSWLLDWLARDVLPAETRSLLQFPLLLYASVYTDVILLTIAPFSWEWLLLTSLRLVKTLVRDLHLLPAFALRATASLVVCCFSTASSASSQSSQSPGGDDAARLLTTARERWGGVNYVLLHQRLLCELCSKLIVLSMLCVELLPSKLGGHVLVPDPLLSAGAQEAHRWLLLAGTACQLLLQIAVHVTVLLVLRSPAWPRLSLLHPSGFPEQQSDASSGGTCECELTERKEPLLSSATTLTSDPAIPGELALVAESGATDEGADVHVYLQYWTRYSPFFVYCLTVGGWWMIRDSSSRVSWQHRSD